MKTRTFGKKCKCGHFESEHNVQKLITPIPELSTLGILLPHSSKFIETIRIDCKICDCKKFNS